MLHFDIGVRERVQDLPHYGNSAKRIHPTKQASNKHERRQQDCERQQQEPNQEERNPKTKRTALLVAQADNRHERNHFSASISRIASSALISPCCKRAKISAFDGVGLVSTNSRLLAMRVRRDLMVG